MRQGSANVVGSRTRTVLVLSFLVILILSAGSTGPAATPKIDLLLLNAHVIFPDKIGSPVQALAIGGQRIAWIGSDEQARRLYPSASRTIDLHGATVLPGLIDAHTHLMELGQSMVRLNLKDVISEEQALELVRQRVASTAPGEWILGWGWDEGKWAGHYPSNRALSQVSPQNPVYLVGLHTFAAWANTRALQLAGITKETKDPENGAILHETGTGEATGILLNRAQLLVESKIPPPTVAQVRRAIELAAHECVRNGLTSVHEAKVSPTALEALRELVKEGRLPLRVYVMLDGSNQALVQEWLERGPEIDSRHRLTVRAFKLFADGALGSRGARLLEPYTDAPETKGLITTPSADIYRLTHSALERGFQVSTHAIGDAANRIVLDAYQKAMVEVPTARDPRLRIEHAQVLAPEDIPRFRKLGVIASMQPTHSTSDMGWAEKRLGPERVKGAYAWRSLLKTGAHLPLSSDLPGESLNPFYGIYAAVTRQDPQGNPPGGWHPEQRLTLEEALRGYTIEAAYAEFEENNKGSIDPGKLADFTVISEDITAASPKEILSVRVLKTFIGGELIYDSERDK
jgi:predicted amidohydrolase YtcJ